MKRLESRSSLFVVSSLAKIALPRDATAVDAPCGFGRHTIELCKRGFKVTAVDIDQSRADLLSAELERRRFDAKQYEIVVADIERDSVLADRTFDLALIVDYASESGISRLLPTIRSGGYILIETPRAIGGNWQDLPAPGRIRSMLLKDFDLILYDERAGGPTGLEAASAKCIGRRRGVE